MSIVAYLLEFTTTIIVAAAVAAIFYLTIGHELPPTVQTLCGAAIGIVTALLVLALNKLARE